MKASTLAIALTFAGAAQADARGFACPDAWIENRMPGIAAPGRASAPRDYFVVGGARRAIRPGERALARRRCGLAPRIVR
ncbi:MAG: hypothetical protein HZY79_03770 [Rhodoblastus sp.]|nr:MAG: hypothetical protein HZY79_03770 [Rhodoblastus sp.]